MAPKNVAVIFTNNKEVYRPGELVSGECIIELTDAVTARAVRLFLHGQALVKWEETEFEVGHVGHYVVPKSKTKDYISRENYFKYVMTVWGRKVNEAGQATQLLPGTHRWTFSFRLPNRTLPSSFESQYGAVRYWLKVEIDKPFPWPNVKRYRCFTVLDDLNMNTLTYKYPVKGSNSKTVSKVLGIGNAGQLTLQASTDRNGYCPGEDIGITATMTNESTKDMGRTVAKLVQRTRCLASGNDKSNEVVVGLIQGTPIKKGETKKWEWEKLRIEPVPPSSRTGSCHILKVSYYVKIYIEVPFGFDLHLHMPIVIGTVPSGFRTEQITAANASLSPRQYAKCSKGCVAFTESETGFPYLAYTTMNAYVQNFKFVPPNPQQLIAASRASATRKAPTGRTSSLPEVHSGFLICSFPSDKLQEFQSTLRANKSTLEEYDGRVICLTDKVNMVDGYPWCDGKGVAILIFASKEKARSWVKTTPEVSEGSWLGGVDIAVMTMREPHNEGITQGFFSFEISRCPRAISAAELSTLGKLYTHQMRSARKQLSGSLLVSAGSKNYENIRGKIVSSPQIFYCMEFPSASHYEKYACLLQTGEYKVGMDFWKTLYRLESQGTMDSQDKNWLTAEAEVKVVNAQTEKAETDDDVDLENAAYLLVKFPFTKFNEFQDAIKSSKKSLDELKGRPVAMAPQVMATKGKWPVGICLGVLSFRVKEDSKSWLKTVSEDKKYSWLSECEVLVMNVRESPHDDYGTFTMTMFKGKLSKEDSDWLVKSYAPAVRSIRSRHGGVVLFSGGPHVKNCESLQGQWLDGNFRLSCVQWPDSSSFFCYRDEIKDEKSGIDNDRVKKCFEVAHMLLFETSDLSWFDEGEDEKKEDSDQEGEESDLVEYTESPV